MTSCETYQPSSKPKFYFPKLPASCNRAAAITVIPQHLKGESAVEAFLLKLRKSEVDRGLAKDACINYYNKLPAIYKKNK